MSEVTGGQPLGWVKTTLSEVTSVSRAKAEPANFGEVPYIGLEHIESGSNRLLSIGTVEDVKSTKSVFQRGDVLYGKLRPYLKKVCRPDFDGVCSTDILVFSELPNLDNGYLLYFLSQQSTTDYATQNSNGINLPRISSSTLGEIEFPLPPLAEQRRIVAKIEALQERSRRARETLLEVGPLLEQFRQSVLAAAFRGDLTADWRAAHPNVEPASELLHRIRAERRRRWEQAELAKYKAKGQNPPKNWKEKYKEPELIDDSDLPELPEGWCWVSVDIVSEVVRGASPRPAGDPKYFNGDHTPWITVQEITKDDEIYLTNTATCLTEAGCGESRFIPSGILLLTNSGATLGVPKITKIGGCINDGSVAIISVSGPFQLYLYFYLRSLTESLRRINQGAAQPNLNTDLVRQIMIPMAPAAEQEEIIEKLNVALSTYRSLKREIPEITGEMEQLDQAILAKAFRGELVPQDPGDEPASALLERIREQRAQQVEATKGNRKASRTQRRNQMGKKSPGLASQRRPLAEVLTANGQPMTPEQLLTESGYDDDSIEEFYLALRKEVEKGRIRENRPTESDVMLEAVKP